MSSFLKRETEIRHLSLSQRKDLAEILEIREAWKFLMASIKVETDTGSTQPKYSSRHISLVERAAKVNAENVTGTEILLDEWGTSGEKRPTLQVLMDLLAELKLYRAADYISMSLLGGAPVPRAEPRPQYLLESDEENRTNEAVVTDDPAPEIIPYSILEENCGWNYANATIKEECIGVGAFAIVFRATVPGVNEGKPVAVKRFHIDNANSKKQFESELQALCLLKHQNIIRLLGVSEGNHRCLLLELMDGGNLEDNLACKRRSDPIRWRARLGIALGASAALQHLHRLRYVHRDIKSANILLDLEFRPKLADFGLMKLDENDDDEDDDSKSQTEIAGTSCYMSPEAVTYGRYSAKSDVFSFGVVLLELLTSLPPNDSNRMQSSLLLHVEEECEKNSIATILDTSKAGQWGGQGQPVAHKLYNLAVHCVNRREEMRPNMQEVLDKLEQLTN